MIDGYIFNWRYDFYPHFGGKPFFLLVMLFFVFVVLWSLLWKGLALWRAARKGQKRWFIALLITNTLGILEILYLYVFSKNIPQESLKNKNDSEETVPSVDDSK